MTRFASEAEMAAVVVDDLEAQGYTVRKEVQIGRSEDLRVPVVDIVAEKGAQLWAIETKLTMSLDLVVQAHRLRAGFHRASIAFPCPRYGDFRSRGPRQNKMRMRIELLRTLGIGALVVNEAQVATWLDARVLHPTGDVRRWFSDEQLNGQAGASGGGYDTAFKRYVRRLEDFVRANPGCSMTDMVDPDNGVEPHYKKTSTARTCITKYIRSGVIKTIEARGGGIRRGYYIVEESQ